MIGKTIRSLIEDRDEYRRVPIGTLGKVTAYDHGLYTIVWKTGAVTRWTRREIERDSEETGD